MRIISGTARGTKLFTLEGLETRPTLDRVKEPLFSIIQNKIQDSNVLDLFAGSGALGIEALSRGANLCVFCDCSNRAINIIKQNLEKTRCKDKAIVIPTDYISYLEKVRKDKFVFDIIFLNPPYDSDLIYLAVKKIKEINILNQDGIIIAETDNDKSIVDKLKKIDINIIDIRKYGRVKLLFLN